MTTGNPWRKKWLNGLVWVQKRLLRIRKVALVSLKKMRPFLAPKFWVIYLIAFSLGFYLWGPFHGWQQISSWQIFKQRSDKNPTVETLQKELDKLKNEIKVKQSPIPTASPTFNPASFSPPADGRIRSGFEWRSDQGLWHLHTGLDIETKPNSNIIAAAEGRVTTVILRDNGYEIRVDHGSGWESLYSNLMAVTVHPGDLVIKGAIIGHSGNSVCNNNISGFHFAVYKDQKAVDPVNIVQGLTE